MINQDRVNENNQPFRTVLILQAEHAHWFQLRGRNIEKYCCENIRQDDLDAGSQCQWLQEAGARKPVGVELVLDTSLDELDRVTVELGKHYLLNRYRRWVTRLRLARDYPKATVYALPQGYGDYVAAIMRPVIPAHWSSWLESQQLSNTVFLRVKTGSEVAACWSEKYNECVLLRMKSACFERHLLIDAGVMLFLRTISTQRKTHVSDLHAKLQSISEDSLDTKEQHTIDDTVEYLADIHLVKRDNFQSISVGINTSGAMETLQAGAVIDTVRQLALVPESNTGNNPHAVAATNAKTAMDIADSEEVPASALIILHMLLDSDFASECSDEQGASNGFFRQIPYRFSKRVFSRILDWYSSGAGAGSVLWSGAIASSSSHRWLDALQQSHKYVLSSRQHQYMRRASLVFLLVALLSAGVSLVNVFGGLRVIKHNKNTLHEVVLESRQLSLDIIELSSLADAADSLLLADQLGRAAAAVPAELLNKIATVITAHPDIALDSIIWNIISEDDSYASLDNSISVATIRRTLMADEEPAWLQLELIGRVSGNTLAIQQSVFEMYVDDLSAMNDVSDTRVFDYPADNALSSEFEKGDRSFFKVALILGS